MHRIYLPFISIAIAVAILSTAIARAQISYLPIAELTAFDGTVGSGLGTAVAASGDIVVIGENCVTCTVSRAGAVYVYQKPANGWQSVVQIAKLTESDGYPGDGFGSLSVAISGGTIVVGATTGKAYVFVEPSSGQWTNATETAELEDGSDGYSNLVAIDSDTIVVGEWDAMVNGVGQGAGFVFTRPAAGWVTTDAPNARLTASDSGQDELGLSVAVNGNTIALGAPLAQGNNGGVYVYEKPFAGWRNATQTAILTRSHPQLRDVLGRGLAIDGPTIAAGVTGAFFSRGAVDIFTMPASGWSNTTETAELTPPAQITPVDFGAAISLNSGRIVVSDDGNRFTLGSNVYLYTMSATGGWTSTSSPEVTFVTSGSDGFAMANDFIVVGESDKAINGNINAGVAFVFEPTPATGFSRDFSSATGLTLNGSAAISGTSLQLTDGGSSEAGSAFYDTPVSVQSFTTDFTFQLMNPLADGFTFTIQNAGPTALGGPGGNLGYAHIPHSVAIKFDLYNGDGEGPNSTGLYADGALPSVPAIDLTGSGINLHSGHLMDAHIAYDGTSLKLTLTDLVTLATWSHLFTIDIAKAIGGSAAYIGFTGSTGGLSAIQQILSWSYQSPVQPYIGPAFLASSVLNTRGSTSFPQNALELTDGGLNESGSAFYFAPQDIRAFATDFTFQQTNADADGFTFIIQSDGTAPLGGRGGALGYAGILASVAIKFDLYNNDGEGPDSTGIYLGGATPTVPSIDLTHTGIDLHSGDIMDAYLTYDGTTLKMTLTDLATLATWSHSFVVDIPSAVGLTSAFVGFTGSTGGLGAKQQILSWTFE